MLDENPLAQAWLSQFPLVDQQVGRQFLRSLRLISSSDFELHLDQVLDKLLSDVGDETLALFSVPELISQERRDRMKEGTLRRAGSSSDRMKHYLENYARANPRRVRAHPTVLSMRAERVRNVVLVEDFIGSGRRISTYLKKMIHPSIKSWVSYGWTKLWIVAYGGLREGIWNIQARRLKLSEDSFRLAFPPNYSASHFSDAMLDFCRSQASRTNRSQIPMGFGNGGTNLIFEHGCPNNTPVILWAQGSKRRGRGEKFKPLFPNRGIPTELRPNFGAPASEVAPEILWDARQYRLALALLKEKKYARQSGLWPVPVALGIASRHRWDDEFIADRLGLPLIQVEGLREFVSKLGALDPQTGEVTLFGKSFLDLIRSSATEQAKQTPRRQRDLSALYYPRTCEGRTQN